MTNIHTIKVENAYPIGIVRTGDLTLRYSVNRPGPCHGADLPAVTLSAAVWEDGSRYEWTVRYPNVVPNVFPKTFENRDEAHRFAITKAVAIAQLWWDRDHGARVRNEKKVQQGARARRDLDDLIVQEGYRWSTTTDL